MDINWVKAYNRLFAIINTPGETYHSGGQFLDVIREVDPGVFTYKQLIDHLNSKGLGTSRKDYYYYVIQTYSDIQKLKIFKAFIEKLEPLVPDKTKEIKEILTENSTGPSAQIPESVWNADRLTEYLENMDSSITEKRYNHTLTLAYTCLEGFFKSFIITKIPSKTHINDLTGMAVEIRDYLKLHFRSQGIAYPEQMIVLISTITNALCNSRNHFSDSHFNDDSEKWLAEFARDCVNSIVRMLLKFI